MNAGARLRELGLELPEVPKPVTKYVPTSSSWISRGMPHFFKNSSNATKAGLGGGGSPSPGAFTPRGLTSPREL